jgi:hypothetical protein
MHLLLNTGAPETFATFVCPLSRVPSSFRIFPFPCLGSRPSAFDSQQTRHLIGKLERRDLMNSTNYSCSTMSKGYSCMIIAK